MIDENDKIKGLFDSESEEIKKSFQSSIDAISSIFRNYSVEDITSSLFVSNIWLPNAPSTVTHQFLTAILATMNPETFLKENSIKKYGDFKELLVKIYAITPSFPSLEDFVPELDWGEVKFYFDNKIYRMLYGGELSNIHEYLMLFQMFYGPYDERYLDYSERSPNRELKFCLELQEILIQEITTQPNGNDLNISNGHREIPPDYFWENAKTFYSNFRPEEIVPETFIEDFSINIGEFKSSEFKYDNFGDQILCGTLLPSFFLRHENKYFMILPRRYSSILFDHWARIFSEYGDKIEPDISKYVFCLGAELHRYLKARINNRSLFPLVSAVTPEGRPYPPIFTSSFISDNNLFFIYLTKPTLDTKNTENELKEIAPELIRALNFLGNQPTTLALHLDRQNMEIQSQANQHILEPLILVVIPKISTQPEYLSIPENLPGRVMHLDAFLGIIDELDNDITLSGFCKYLDTMDTSNCFNWGMLDMFASFKDSSGVLIEGAVEPNFLMLDPHWGTTSRYKSLVKFWENYPDVNYFDHPRAWKIYKETETRTRRFFAILRG